MIRGSDAWRRIADERRGSQAPMPPTRQLMRDGVVTHLPDVLPDSLSRLLSDAGVPVRRLQGGQLLESSTDMAFSDWTLELRVSLSCEEGEAVLGSLWSNFLVESEDEGAVNVEE